MICSGVWLGNASARRATAPEIWGATKEVPEWLVSQYELTPFWAPPAPETWNPSPPRQ